MLYGIVLMGCGSKITKPVKPTGVYESNAQNISTMTLKYCFWGKGGGTW